MYRFMCICKDPAGMKNIVPIVHELRARGEAVVLVANGKGSELLTGKEAFYSALDLANLTHLHEPSIVITDMSSGGGVGCDFVKAHSDIMTIAIQDFWGARLLTDWRDARPTHIVVNDPVGKRLVLEAWPDYSTEQIIVSGYPSLDVCTPNPDVIATCRAKLREVYGVDSDRKVVFYAGQLGASGETLETIIEELAVYSDNVFLIVASHPRLDSYCAARIAWDRAIAHEKHFPWSTCMTHMPFNDVVRGADIVIGMYSTTLVDAAVMRKPVISVMFPDLGAKELSRETGGLLTSFPLGDLKCCHTVKRRSSLDKALHAGLEGDLPTPAMIRNLNMHFAVDGKNTARLVDKIR